MLRIAVLTLLLALGCVSGAVADTLPSTTQVHGDDQDHVIIQSPGETGWRLVGDTEPLNGGTLLTPPAGCGVSGIGSGQLVASCPSTEFKHVALQVSPVATQAWSLPAGLQKINETLNSYCCADNESFSGGPIGSALLGVVVDGGHGTSVPLFDPATGAQVEPKAGRHEYETLDSPTGEAPLCAPVVRERRSYEDPYGGWFRTLEPAWQVGAWTIRWWHDVRIQHCGSTRVRRFTAGLHSRVVLNDRFAAWAGKRTLHVFWLSSGRHQEIRLRKPTWFPVSYSLTGTRHRLFVNSNVGPPWPLQWFQLP